MAGSTTVFNTAELAEQIMLELSPLQVVQARQISKFICNTIKNSPKLRRKLFLDKVQDDENMYWIFDSNNYKLFTHKVNTSEDPSSASSLPDSTTVKTWKRLILNPLLTYKPEDPSPGGPYACESGALMTRPRAEICLLTPPSEFSSSSTRKSSSLLSTKYCGRMFVTSPPSAEVKLVCSVRRQGKRKAREKIFPVDNASGVRFADVVDAFHSINGANPGRKVELCNVRVEGAVLVTEEERREVES